jgi:hypothetical protein
MTTTMRNRMLMMKVNIEIARSGEEGSVRKLKIPETKAT